NGFQEIRDPLQVRQRLRGRAAHVAEIVSLAHRHHIVEPMHAERGAAFGAPPLSPGTASAPFVTSSASANCGSSFGGTNEHTSMSRTPAATSALIQARLRRVGTAVL